MPTYSPRRNTSRRGVLRTYTEQTFYPTMFAKDIPYGARSKAYSGTRSAAAEAAGQIVGTAAGTLLTLQQTQQAYEAQKQAEREATKRAQATANVVETIKGIVPWVVGGAVVLVLGSIFLKTKARSS